MAFALKARRHRKHTLDDHPHMIDPVHYCVLFIPFGQIFPCGHMDIYDPMVTVIYLHLWWSCSCSFERTETSTMFHKTTTALMNHCHPPGKHVNFKEKEWDKPLEIEEFMEHVLDEHKVSSKSWPPIDPVANHLILSSPPHHLIVTQVTLNGSLLLAIALLTEEERKQLIIIVKPRQVYN